MPQSSIITAKGSMDWMRIYTAICDGELKTPSCGNELVHVAKGSETVRWWGERETRGKEKWPSPRQPPGEGGIRKNTVVRTNPRETDYVTATPLLGFLISYSTRLDKKSLALSHWALLPSCEALSCAPNTPAILTHLGFLLALGEWKQWYRGSHWDLQLQPSKLIWTTGEKQADKRTNNFSNPASAQNLLIK